MNLTNPHNLTSPVALNHVLETELVTAYFYSNIVVVEAHEGVTLSYKTAFSLLVKGLQFTLSKPFVYISNRVNSYSLNPNDYIYLEKIPTLKGIAIVAPTELGKQNAELELNFFKKPMEIFDETNDAFEWAKMIVESSR